MFLFPTTLKNLKVKHREGKCYEKNIKVNQSDLSISSVIPPALSSSSFLFFKLYLEIQASVHQLP